MPARRAPDGLREVIRDYRRDQVIDVARRLFGERGTTEVSVDEIAAQAGVARSTVYVYFANRDELLRACLKGMHDQLIDDLARDWDEDDEPPARLLRLIRGMFERIDADPAFFRLALVAQAPADQGAGALDSELALIGLNIARLIRDLYLDGVGRDLFLEMDADRATSLIGQQIYGAMSVRSAEPLPEPLDTAADHVCRFILRGLGASEPGV